MLEKLLDELESKKGMKNYRIPSIWIGDFPEKELIVDPYEFFFNSIKKIYDIETSKYKEIEPRKNLSKDVFYSVLLRTATAYPHSGKFEPIDKNGYKNSGTILKTITILPYLHRLGVNTLYLLPISKYSKKYKKGELGSPYAVKNFVELDPELQDPLSKLNVEEQFTALVEAAHKLKMKVIIDFIPRTAARDNDLILEHPDWFYWIKSEYEEIYHPPVIENLDFQQPSSENLEIVYNNKNTKEHLKMFSFSPDILDKQKWENFVKKNKGNPNFIEEIKKEFGVVTPPGFSDWINDKQPLWSDITFLRLYLSHPKEALKYIDGNLPPYLLFDVIKASKFPGKIKNEGLWDFLRNIIPFYQKKYKIDGARIDMGHALPKELEKIIIEKARKIDPNFIFIAEEFDMKNDKKAKENGYDLILGNSWWSEPRIDEGEMEKFIYNILPNLEIPTFATSETPDTPRSVVRKYGRKFSKFSAVLNAFLPNATEFINCGFEFYEKQPMNLGLDNDENGRFVLEPDDPFYGKLAFFDHYCLHWKNDFDIYNILEITNKIKKENKDILERKFLRSFDTKNNKILSIHYQSSEKGLLVLANKNFSSSEFFEVNFKITRRLKNYMKILEEVRGKIELEPGEVSVFTYDINDEDRIKFKVEYNYLKPHKKYHSDGGWDLRSKIDLTIKPREIVSVPTGVQCSIPSGYVGFVKPRSGLAVKYGIDTLAGVIDSDYRGEIKVVLINHGKKEFKITKGDRIAQLVVVKVLLKSKIVDNLDITIRNENGFGSTGRR